MISLNLDIRTEEDGTMQSFFSTSSALRTLLQLGSIACVALLVACGSSDGGSTPPSASVSGTFVDSPVDGLRSTTTSNPGGGFTSGGGHYQCQRGDSVTFWIGTKQIGNAQPCSSGVVTAVSVFGASSITDNRVVNLARLLLTLGGPPNANNIIQLPSTLPPLPGTLDFSLSTTAFAAAILAAGGPPLVLEADANMHLQTEFKTLSVTVVNNGTVTSNPAGIINCTAGTCTYDFVMGTAVTLTAMGTGFTGWSGGGCSGTSSTCQVSLTANTTVTALGSTSTGFVYPLTVDPTSHYLVDQTGKPFLLVGDAAWSLVVAVSDSDADFYLENRKQLGFTAILVNLLEHQNAAEPPKDFYGLTPFTGQAFKTPPNDAYFAHVDYIVKSAAAKGIVILLSPLYLGASCGSQGWCAEVKAATPEEMMAWGHYVGNRYKDDDNIVWVIGGDTNPTQVLAKVQAVVDGILSADLTPPPFTAHNDLNQMAVTPWPGATWLNVNNVYSVSFSLYESFLNAYSITPPMPVFLVEARYENGITTPLQLRAQSYWSVLSGGFGLVFGNCPLWSFGFPSNFCAATDWKDELNSEGSLDMQRFQALFNSRHWQTLVPDMLPLTILTAGYGTFGTPDYAQAAYAADGSSIIVYLPSSRLVTVSGARLADTTMTAWWYNPSNGGATKIGTGLTTGTQNFTPPSSGDWVLVLDSTNVSFPPPGQ